jgi:type III pantothenate kinase
MNLLVDIGNSRIKCIQQNEDGLSGYRVDVYDKSRIAQSLDNLWGELPAPEQIWIANVAGSEAADQIVQWVVQHWHKKPTFAVVEKQLLGVTNAYSEINRLGIDRWLALVATWHKYKSPACIVSCGTAVTIDGMDHQGTHLGGLIMPGISMMQQSLHIHTSAIPYIKDKQAAMNLAGTTEQAVVTGCTLAVISLIEHVLQDLRHVHDEKLKCVITGGDSEGIMNLLTEKFIHKPYLVLEGLALVASSKS